MYKQKYIRLAGLLILAAACATCRAAGHPSAPLKKALAVLRFQEDAVRNIRIAAFAKFWQSGNAETKMLPSGEVKSVALYDGLPRGKFLIRVFRDIAPWSNGKGPFSFSTYMLGYDGRVGTFFRTVDGTPQHKGIAEDGWVMGKNPLYLYGYLDCDNGWAESIFGFTSFPEFIPPYHLRYRRFSAFLATGQPLTTIRARFVVRQGNKLLRVTRVGPPLGKDVFLLDPRHGYSIARYGFYGFTTRKGSNGTVMKGSNGRVLLFPGTHRHVEFQVTGFFEPLPGVFFPKQIKRLGFAWWKNKGTRIIAKTVINISKVSVNTVKVNNGTYRVTFPRGALVVDNSTGQTIYVGGTPSQEAREIGRAVGEARKAARAGGVAKPR